MIKNFILFRLLTYYIVYIIFRIHKLPRAQRTFIKKMAEFEGKVNDLLIHKLWLSSVDYDWGIHSLLVLLVIKINHSFLVQTHSLLHRFEAYYFWSIPSTCATQTYCKFWFTFSEDTSYPSKLSRVYRTHFTSKNF